MKNSHHVLSSGVVCYAIYMLSMVVSTLYSENLSVVLVSSMAAANMQSFSQGVRKVFKSAGWSAGCFLIGSAFEHWAYFSIALYIVIFIYVGLFIMYRKRYYL